MNWGDNLTLVGAIRRDGWLTLSTKWRAMTKACFIDWVRRGLAPRLRRGDVVLLDNLQAHKAPRSVRSSNGVAPRCATCRPTRMISIPSNPHRDSSRNASVPTLRGPPAPPATSCVRIIAINGLPMPGKATQVLSGIVTVQAPCTF